MFISRKTMNYSTNINGINVSLSFESWQPKEYSVDFKINGYYDIDPSISKLNKIKITRWLLTSWKHFLSNQTFDIIRCYAYQEDGEGEYREKVYKKLGFEEENSIARCYRK
jgi:hypothetical protein